MIADPNYVDWTNGVGMRSFETHEMERGNDSFSQIDSLDWDNGYKMCSQKPRSTDSANVQLNAL
jgi:hypothetical protein